MRLGGRFDKTKRRIYFKENGAGLGVMLNDDEVKRHPKPGTGYFEPTPMWDEKQSWDDAAFSERVVEYFRFID